MSITEYLRNKITRLHIREDVKLGILMELSSIDTEFQKLNTKLSRARNELDAIREMHECKPIMPFYDKLPSASIAIPNNIYELRMAVQGKVEQDAERPVVALSVREYGQPKNFSTQVWVDKFELLSVKDREELINHTLENIRRSMYKLFDKEFNRV